MYYSEAHWMAFIAAARHLLRSRSGTLFYRYMWHWKYMQVLLTKKHYNDPEAAQYPKAQRCSCLNRCHQALLDHLHWFSFSANSFHGSLSAQVSYTRIMSATSKHAYLWSHPALFDFLILNAKYQPIPLMDIFGNSKEQHVYLLEPVRFISFFNTAIIKYLLYCFEEGLPTFVVWACL